MGHPETIDLERDTKTGALNARIRDLADAEVEAVAERKIVLRDGMTLLDKRLAELSERDRQALLSLLYRDMGRVLFDYHLGLELMLAREHVREAPTGAGAMAAVQQLGATAQELCRLYKLA